MNPAVAHPEDVDVTDPVTGVMNAAGWQTVLRLEDGRADRYGGNPAVLLVELDGTAGPPSDAGLARAAAVVDRVIRDTDVVARVGSTRLAVLASDGGAQVSYLAARLRVLLALEGVHPTSIRARSRAGYHDLAAAWAAALADDPAASEAPPRRRRRPQVRLRNTGFLEGLVSELRLDLALVAGVGRRLEQRHRPDLVELGGLLRRHATGVESLVAALDLLAGRTDRPELVDPAAMVRAACARQGATVAGDIRWAAPISANRARLRAGFSALLEAVAPSGAPPSPVAVSDSGLTLTFSTSGDLLDDTRRTWRLRLARRFLEHEGGRLRIRAVPEGLRVEAYFPG